MAIPEPLLAELEELLDISLECCGLLFKQTRALFDQSGGIRALAQTIDRQESHCDHIARRLLSKLFATAHDAYLKLPIKALVEKIEEISNRADDVAKRIMIIRMKRRV